MLTGASHYCLNYFRSQIKQLENLIAQAEVTSGGFERTYNKMGTLHTDKHKVWVELTTSDNKVKSLVDFVNKNDPTVYDYPVSDIQVEPITVASNTFINWVNRQTSKKVTNN